MSPRLGVGHSSYSLLPWEIDGVESLAELALDMRWSWDHATDTVWRQLDPELWEFTQNPWVVLQTVSRDKVERALADPAFPRWRRDTAGGGANLLAGMIAGTEGTMKRKTSIRCLFLDIGGVLLSDGWDRRARKRAANELSLRDDSRVGHRAS